MIDRFGINPEKISVTHLASNLKPSSVVAKLPFGRPYLLYVGGRVGYKNFHMLLESYAASLKVRSEFDLVCFGSVWTKVEFEHIAQLGLTECVRWVGGEDSKLVSFYQGARLLVYPSIYEGFGLPPLEAMQLGCPVLCTANSSIPEVVGDAGIYFEARDIDSLRYALEDLVFDDGRLVQLRQAGRERADSFSWSRCAEQTLSVYKTFS